MQSLQVALIWHMHQPDYRDPASGRILLPWTYLHAVKDYSEMLRTVREVPGARTTFNLVPTLLEQLADYQDGRAKDLWLETARMNPQEMTDGERTFAVSSFFRFITNGIFNPIAAIANWPGCGVTTVAK